MLTPRSSEDVKANWYMYLNTQQNADELYAANDGEFFRKFFLPTHPELDEVWSRMKDPRALHAMLNWARANPVAKMYLDAINAGVEIRPCRVPTSGIWSAGDASPREDPTKDRSKIMTDRKSVVKEQRASERVIK